MRQLHEYKPSTHSFITGNMVRLSKRARPRNAAPGPYKIFAQLPERDGQLQYRVKSGYEPFYRTVTENELEAHVGATATSGRPFLCPSGIEVGLRHKVLTEADIGNSGLGPAVERQ